MNENPVTNAIKVSKGAPNLARNLGVTAQAVYKWERAWDAGRIDAVPPRRAVEIERAVGIPRHRLRPDLWSPPCESA